MKTIAFYNLKGGVGKTAAAVNIAALAAQSGIRTLIWDLDPQGSTSWYFKSLPKSDSKLTKLIKGKTPIGPFIRATDDPDLDIIPSDMSYRNLDVKLDRLGAEDFLKNCLAPLSEDYQLVILDCAPHLSTMTEGVFSVCNRIYVPLIPTPLSIQTYSKILEFFKDQGLKKKKLRPFFSMVDRRKSIHKDIVSKPPIQLDGQLSGYIPYSADIEKMGLTRAPVFAFAPRSTGALAYRLMWEEMQSQVKS